MPPFEVTTSVAAPVSLADYTGRELVLPWLRERDTAGVIGELCRVMQSQGVVSDMLPFYHAVLNQELLDSTVVEKGLAVPHARTAAVRRLRFAYGRLPEPVKWGTGQGAAARHVFLVAVPAGDAVGYLHLLAGLARLGQHATWLSLLETAEDADEILGVFERVEMRKS